MQCWWLLASLCAKGAGTAVLIWYHARVLRWNPAYGAEEMRLVRLAQVLEGAIGKSCSEVGFEAGKAQGALLTECGAILSHREGCRDGAMSCPVLVC